MKRGAWWPIGITAVLATTVGANIWVMVIAGGDPSFAVEPDYYRKAIAWDTTMAQAQRNAVLGWHLTSTMGPIASDGYSLVTARLTDSAGAGIPNAVVRLAALPIARAKDVREATLVPDGSGAYVVRLDARRPGQWELRFDAVVGSERFTQVARVEARRDD